MKNIFLILAILSLTFSCNKETDKEIVNEIDKPGSQIFQVDSVNYLFSSQNSKDIFVSFLPLVYDQLTDIQKGKITGYIVYKNGVERFNFENDRDWFIDTSLPNGSNVCYAVAYRTDKGTSNRSDVWCFTIPF